MYVNTDNYITFSIVYKEGDKRKTNRFPLKTSKPKGARNKLIQPTSRFLTVNFR